MWILRRYSIISGYEAVKYFGPFQTGEEAEEYAHKLSNESKGGAYSPLELIPPEVK